MATVKYFNEVTQEWEYIAVAQDGADGADSTVPGPTGQTGPQGNPGPPGSDSTIPGPTGPPGAGYEPLDVLDRPELRAVTETVVALGNVTGTRALNLSSGNVFTGTLTGNATFTFGTVPAGGAGKSFTLILTHSGAGRSVTWPASVKWAGGDAPDISDTSGGVDVLTFISTNGGSAWLGMLAGAGFA